VAGAATSSIAANIISKLDENSTEDDIRVAEGVPATMYMASVDTVSSISVLDVKFSLIISQTASSVNTFILTMILYPEVQRRAQAEIDQVVGNSRLPNFSDEGALPYVQAVLKEVSRWHPVGPLGRWLCVTCIVCFVNDYFCRRAAQGHRGRCLRRVSHSWRLDHYTKRVVRVFSEHPSAIQPQ
jgi:hypothetical protein